VFQCLIEEFRSIKHRALCTVQLTGKSKSCDRDGTMANHGIGTIRGWLGVSREPVKISACEGLLT
jgi:hypothetical protein